MKEFTTKDLKEQGKLLSKKELTIRYQNLHRTLFGAVLPVEKVLFLSVERLEKEIQVLEAI